MGGKAVEILNLNIPVLLIYASGLLWVVLDWFYNPEDNMLTQQENCPVLFTNE